MRNGDSSKGAPEVEPAAMAAAANAAAAISAAAWNGLSS
jgi:hypothetical protein